MYKRKTNMLISLVLFVFVSFAGCDSDGTAKNGDGDIDNEYPFVDGDQYVDNDYTVESDLMIDGDWMDGDIEYTEIPETNDKDATNIVLGCDETSITGYGASVEDGDVVISSAGIYIISGKLCDGQIRIDTEDVDPVFIVLNGVDVTSSSSAALFVVSAEIVYIKLEENTDNVLTDGNNYTYENSEENDPNAALHSKSDLVIHGTGSLIVNANFNDGITGKDDLVIKNGTINVTAKDDGIRGKDSLTIEQGTISVVSTGDGLISDNEEDGTKGNISIYNANITITSSGDGLAAETDVVITGGVFNVTSGGGSEMTISETESAKGIKGNGSVYIGDGTFTIDSADDGIHSNGDILIDGGNFTISVTEGQQGSGGGGGMHPGGGDLNVGGQDGMHSDTTLQINEGNILITKSYEGIEAMTIIVNGGNISITASDDGFNCAGGDGSSGWKPGEVSSGEYYLIINDGYIWMNANGDGLDSNGSIEINGGVILVNGPTNDGNGAIDSGDGRDNYVKVTGGFLVAAGSSGMAEYPDETSSQNSVIVFLSNTQQAGQIFHIQNGSGEELLTYAPCKNYRSVVFSSPKFSNGEYSVYLGGSNTGTNNNGLYESGTYHPGTLYETFNVFSVTTQVGSGGGFHR